MEETANHKTIAEKPRFIHWQIHTQYCILSSAYQFGEVPERLIGALSKSVVAVRSPWVRIPPSPLKRDTLMGVSFL